MKTRNFYYTLLLLFFLSNYKLGLAQINTSPIEYEILLSGNFGELRSSGFHTGIDIKTKGREGEIIKAIDDGYISRMQVSTTGYGKATPPHLSYPGTKMTTTKSSLKYRTFQNKSA